MRAGIDGLTSSHRLIDTLPAMLREDPFARDLCDGLDEVLAPVLLSLDCWPAYLDPGTVPADMLGWLGHWLGLGLEADADSDLDQQRARLLEATELHARRGTLRGIEMAVRSAFRVPCQASDSGGVATSTTYGGDLPGAAVPVVVVEVSVPSRTAIDVERLEAVVAAQVPAHVSYRVEVVLP